MQKDKGAAISSRATLRAAIFRSHWKNLGRGGVKSPKPGGQFMTLVNVESKSEECRIHFQNKYRHWSNV